VRSGTSPAPNYAEAKDAESRKDFVHKIKVVLKELRETYVWLRIIQQAKLLANVERIKGLIDECNELISIFVKSVKTAKNDSVRRGR
jgi:four helix bundle protein